MICFFLVHCLQYCAGRGKGRPGSDKLTLMALECLDELLRLGKTVQVIAGMLQDALEQPEQGPEPARPSGIRRCAMHLFTDSTAEGSEKSNLCW